MIRFLIYLFETGMCLTLLFLVYFLFFRKETYFTFNRIYLLSILVLSFALPLLHMNITLPDSRSMESRVTEMQSVKNHYERLIAMSDPDYRNSFTKAFKENETAGFEESGQAFYPGNEQMENVTNSAIQNTKIKTGFWADINWARVLLLLYLLGTLFFTVRLLLLFRWLRQTVNKYGSTHDDGVKLVKMDEEVPPFSFFRFVFLHSETASHSGFSQILAHEKVHIVQRHSLDLILAHALTIIQWFNPFAWLINKAMKTNHEYIADRNVVEQGYELFDYQSLLLKQMISIRSVELVNNFNLINIKKRIAMMTKIKSGLAAQLKALVVIPAAMFVFFFFAEITFAQDAVSFKNKDLTKELQGFWVNTENDSYGKLLYFKENEIQILENKDKYRDYKYEFANSTITYDGKYYKESMLSQLSSNIKDLASFTVNDGQNNLRPITISLKGDVLKVAWTGEQISTYKRADLASSLDYFSNEVTEGFEPVSTSYFRISDHPENTYFLLMNRKGEMLVDGERATFENLPARIRSIKSQGNPFTASEKIPIVVVDARCPMANVHALYHKMREMNELRYILSVKPFDTKVPEVFYHNVGIPRLLPPKDAVLMEEEAVEKSGMKIIRVDLTKAETTPDWAATTFNKEIQADKKYVVLLSYQNNSTYKDYLSILDEFYKSIFAKRNQLAHEKYQLAYDELADAHQKEIRKSLPMIITERNLDMEEE
jgi:hypothetical protein